MKKLFAFWLSIPLLASLSSCGGGTLEDGVFTIGLEAAYAPFNWTTTDKDLGVPIANSGFLGLGRTYVAGYDVEIAQYVAEGNEFDLQVRKIAWDGLIPALQSGSIDAIVAGMTDTPSRRESVSFSSPYYESHLVMVVRADGDFASASSIDDFSGAYLAAQIGTVQNDLIIDYASDDGEDDLYVEGLIAGTPYETYPDALLALLEANSGLDGVLAEEPIGAAMVEQHPSELALVEFWADETTYDDNFVISVSIAVRHEDADLLIAIDATLATLDVTTRVQWMQEAISASQADQ
ncbi:MAG: transporter substrate-binding domain-containing protein [Bacilli bacterium]|jgi:putative lysine transport system substrate-binding protein/putative lysine transport system permease protein